MFFRTKYEFVWFRIVTEYVCGRIQQELLANARPLPPFAGGIAEVLFFGLVLWSMNVQN